MNTFRKLISIVCLLSILFGSHQPLTARTDLVRNPPDRIKDLCYEKLWDSLLHPTNEKNNRARQGTLHEIAELLSKVGYPIESVIPSRRDFSMLMNQKHQEDLYRLIDDSIINLCLLIRDPIPIQTTVTVDYTKTIGNIKDLRQVNDGIFSQSRQGNGSQETVDNSGKMKELGMQSIRTHDAFGTMDPKTKKLICGLDMHYIYPDMNKDPLDPANYQFAIMDKWVQKINEIGASVFFRVGESWGMDPTPPKNVDNYAQAVVQILKHYQQGWANGFYYRIPYWEIWNEPGLKIFWTGTSDQFITLYAKIATALKKEDPSIQVGGPGNAGNFQNDWYFKFLSYIRDHKIPFDFYSWHWYGIRPFEANSIARDVQKDLDAFGFYQTKQFITEWNIDVWGSIDGKKVGNSRERGNQFFNSFFNAGFHGCVLTNLQDSSVEMAHHYRGDANGFGLLDEKGSLNRVGVFYQNLNTLMESPRRLVTVSNPMQEAFTVLAGKSLNGNTIQILVSDARIGENPYKLTINNLPRNKKIDLIITRFNQDHPLGFIETKQFENQTTLELEYSLVAPGFDRIEITLK